jgi:hypothetical protein
LCDHLKQNNIISPHQHGFLSGRSTQTQLLECVNSWSKSLDRGSYVDVLYIDISKAFDTISHAILFHKMHMYGIGGKFLRWVKSFLAERTQKVKVGCSFSAPADVLSGVPQGSVLGPILFLIYINDLPSVLSSSSIKIFADDSKIYFAFRNMDKLDIFTKDVQNVFGWVIKNGLKIAMEKCELLHLGRNNPSIELIVNNVVLPTCTVVRDLGVYVSDSLKFSYHISVVCNRAYQKTGQIFRAFMCREPQFLRGMFIKFVRPLVEFNSCIWSPHLLKDIELVESVQRRFTKRIPCLKNLSYGQRLKFLNLPTLEERRVRFDMLQTFKFIRGYVDIPVDDFFTFSETGLRGHEFKLQVPLCRTDVRKYSFPVRVVKCWNSLPSAVVNATSVNIFKSRLEKVNFTPFLRFKLQE